MSYALTIYQPWAWALCLPDPTQPGDPRPKRVENRSWAPWSPLYAHAVDLIGQRIYLHAGKRYQRREFAEWVVGAIVARVLAKPVPCAGSQGWWKVDDALVHP